jgi:hypothetical protein
MVAYHVPVRGKSKSKSATRNCGGTAILIKEGNPNMDKQLRREHKRSSRGRTFLDFTKTKGAFGNQPVKTIPFGYDSIFPKKIKINV